MDCIRDAVGNGAETSVDGLTTRPLRDCSLTDVAEVEQERGREGGSNTS